MPRPQEHDRKTCGTERVHQEFPLRFDLLLIVTQTGRDYRPGSRKRIEQVARKGSPLRLYSNALSASLQKQLENAEDKSSLMKHIGNLPDEQRQVVMLRHYYEMPFKEIAELTDVSINTALGRMRYALINLRKMFEEEKQNESTKYAE